MVARIARRKGRVHGLFFRGAERGENYLVVVQKESDRKKTRHIQEEFRSQFDRIFSSLAFLLPSCFPRKVSLAAVLKVSLELQHVVGPRVL